MKRTPEPLWQPAGMPGRGDRVKIKGIELFGRIESVRFEAKRANIPVAVLKLDSGRTIKWKLDSLEHAG